MLLATAAYADNNPTLLHTAPTQAEPNTALVVEGTLVGSSQLSRVLIRYRGPGDPYEEAEMELQYGDLYRGAIPAEMLVSPGVEYYVEGVLKTGERVALFMDSAKPARVFVTGGTPREKTSRRPDRTERTEPARREDPPKSGSEPDPVETDPALIAEVPVEEPAPKASPAKKTERSDRRKRDDKRRSEPDPARPVVVEEDDPPAREERASTRSSPDDSQLEEELALYSAVDTVALATRHEEKVTRVPAIASSFNRAQIRALGARTVYDVLDVVPGLSISRDVQGFHRTAIRGLRSDPEVLFLLNGHPLNNFYDGRALANLPVDNIERIEVIRGPGSALYGTGAFLGVVNVVTTTEEEGIRASVNTGSFGGTLDDVIATSGFDGHGDLTRRFGNVLVNADVDVGRHSGYRRPVVRDALTTESVLLGLLEEREYAGFTNDRRLFVNAGAGARFDSGAGGEFGVALRYMNEQRAALIGLFDTVGPDSNLGWQVVFGDLTWRKSLGTKTTLHARAFAEDQQMDRMFQLTPRDFSNDGQVYTVGLRERTRVGTRSFGIDAGADIQLLETNRLSIGAVVESASLSGYAYETNFRLGEDSSIAEYTESSFQRPTEDFEYPQEIGGGAAASRLVLGLYAQDQWTIIEPLTLTLGFRIDATELPTVDADRNITGKAFVPSFNPRAGLVWAVSDPLVVKLLYGRAFRSPTVQELSERIPSTDFNQGRFQGNPDLDPATVDTLELGADLVQAAGDARVRIRGNVFYENFSNPIAAVDDSGNVIPLRNRTLGVRVFGAESEARLEASERANAWVNVSWFRAYDVEATLALLTDTPQLRLNAGMSMPIGRWLNFDLLVKVGVERRNNSRSELEYLRRYRLPQYTLVGAQLRSEKLFDHVEIAASASNLLDVNYADDAPRPDRMPGMVPREGVGGNLSVRVDY